MLIRSAELKDAQFLSKLLGQLGYPTSQTSTLEKIEWYLKDGYKLLVAESDEIVVGFISLHTYHTPHLPGMVGRITAFCVDDKLRGGGIGTTLRTTAEKYFKAIACFKIEVTSNIKRIETHHYYLKVGDQETSKHYVKYLQES